MFSFQAIHNRSSICWLRNSVVYRLCQCSLFKQFTTEGRVSMVKIRCLSIMSMFSFQAIHNLADNEKRKSYVVYRLCQCSLFKQFTTGVKREKSGSSCLSIMSMFSFQAIHNTPTHGTAWQELFIDYVNVLFSSNSQHNKVYFNGKLGCLSIMSMFSFQAIHNEAILKFFFWSVVYRLCQCSLFKQFTTRGFLFCSCSALFIDYVNVLFSSNSQRCWYPFESFGCCLSIMSMFSFQAIHNDGCALYLRKPLFIDYVNVLFLSNSQPRL